MVTGLLMAGLPVAGLVAVMVTLPVYLPAANPLRLTETVKLLSVVPVELPVIWSQDWPAGEVLAAAVYLSGAPVLLVSVMTCDNCDADCPTCCANTSGTDGLTFASRVGSLATVRVTLSCCVPLAEPGAENVIVPL